VGKPIDAGHVRLADATESIVDALERLEISETKEDDLSEEKSKHWQK
jgi:hypothetical protein